MQQRKTRNCRQSCLYAYIHNADSALRTNIRKLQKCEKREEFCCVGIAKPNLERRKTFSMNQTKPNQTRAAVCVVNCLTNRLFQFQRSILTATTPQAFCTRNHYPTLCYTALRTISGWQAHNGKLKNNPGIYIYIFLNASGDAIIKKLFHAKRTLESDVNISMKTFFFFFYR